MTMTAATSAKPIPDPDEASQAFFDGAAMGELRLPRCNSCGTFLGLAAAICTECLSHDLTWTKASGRGTVHTFGVMHQKFPGFEDEVPYNIAQVELEEGPRIITSIVGCANDAIRVGMPVVVSFEKQANGVSIPKFSPIA